jgi:hypothetical protein
VGYIGQIVNIPLGKGGLHTDDPARDIPPTKMTRAENVTTSNGFLEKDYGSMRWNAQAQLPTGVVQLFDYEPTNQAKRMIVVGGNGRVYRFKNRFSFSEMTTEVEDEQTLITNQFVRMVLAGNEETANPRKLFIMTGQNPVQVIEGDSTTRRNIENPSPDWSGKNQPFGMVEFLAQMVAWGNDNAPHTLYVSSALDHEDFLTSPQVIQVYPTEGEAIRAVIAWKRRLIIFKYPKGVYTITPTSADPATWIPVKEFDSFGAVAPYGVTQVLNDVLAANEYGSVSSLFATEYQDNLGNSDLFHVLRCQDFFRNEISKQGIELRHAIYYRDKKQAFISYRSLDSNEQNRIAVINYHMPDKPEVYVNTKDQANALALLKDDFGVERPVYGANDGYIYTMDSPNRWIGDTVSVQNSFEMVSQTPPLDFGFADAGVSERNKIFDFLEVVYSPTGDANDLEIDIFIDHKFSQTLNVSLPGTTDLDKAKLDTARFTENIHKSVRRKISGFGRRITLRARHSGLIPVKLVEYKIYFRLAGQRQKGIG